MAQFAGGLVFREEHGFLTGIEDCDIVRRIEPGDVVDVHGQARRGVWRHVSIQRNRRDRRTTMRARPSSTLRKPDPDIRIAVTGAGIICSIGRNKEEVWQSIAESRAGIGKLTRFRRVLSDRYRCRGEWRSDRCDGRDAKRMSRSDKLAVMAAGEAIAQASGRQSRSRDRVDRNVDWRTR